MVIFGDPSGIRTPDPLLKRQLLCRLSYRIRVKHLLPINHWPRGRIHGQWQGRLDSNQRMRESKSLALPLGYTPIGREGWGQIPSLSFCGVGKGTRTLDTRNHNPVLSRLSYTHHRSEMVRQEGFEPPAHCLEGSCSIRLSYWRACNIWLPAQKVWSG